MARMSTPPVLIALRVDKQGRNYIHLYECGCGNQFKAAGYHVNRGSTKSCGCAKIKHGMSESREYEAWTNMKTRCYNRKSPDFEYYGARGITVCQRWMDSFEDFVKDMGLRPDGMSIDRINNNDGYKPGNCRWATLSEQNKNRRVFNRG